MDISYNLLVKQRGRPPKSERSDFGERLSALRKASGLSQLEVAEHLEISQPSYAEWERRNVAIKPEQVKKLAEVLGCEIEDLFKQDGQARRGPAGRARRLFEEISGFSRREQKEVLDLVEIVMRPHRKNQDQKQAS